MSAFISVPVPAGLTLLPGGNRSQLLSHHPLPDISLNSTDEGDLLGLLSYAGVRYAHPNSPAARAGLFIFGAGRKMILEGRYDAVTFDWDHTFSNYQIFEDLPHLLHVRHRRRPPAAGDIPMGAMEVTRPFMVELALGMMVGFALRQGLEQFSQWRAYQPRVGIASLTWPDRLARLAAHHVPVLPLMEGLLPGDPETYRRFTSPVVRSVIHLHHFLDYCERLFERLRSGDTLTPVQGQEAAAYVTDRKGHHRKPLGTWISRQWPVSRLLHVDDSTPVICDLIHQAALNRYTDAQFVHAPHPHSRVFKDVREWHKISVPAFWRSRSRSIAGVTATLVRQEWTRSNIPVLLKELGVISGLKWPEAGLPAGAVMTVHETPTTIGEVWDYYVVRTRRAALVIREAIQAAGGLSRLRDGFRHTRAA